jgi:hypothetical protein
MKKMSREDCAKWLDVRVEPLQTQQELDWWSRTQEFQCRCWQRRTSSSCAITCVTKIVFPMCRWPTATVSDETWTDGRQDCFPPNINLPNQSMHFIHINYFLLRCSREGHSRLHLVSARIKSGKRSSLLSRSLNMKGRAATWEEGTST